MTDLPREILRRPYKHVLIPDEDSGTFTALIAEFPGCISEGDTLVEAYANLEAAAMSWLEAVIESGMPVPSPEVAHNHNAEARLRIALAGLREIDTMPPPGIGTKPLRDVARRALTQIEGLT